MIIAIDFDGTIVTHEYPKIGTEIPFATQTLKMLLDDGHQLILWTVREGKLLEEAVKWCEEHGVRFYAINKNYLDEEPTNHTYSRKLKADLFIDDRNLGGIPDWGVIYQMISEGKTNQLFSGNYSQRKEKKKRWWVFLFLLISFVQTSLLAQPGSTFNDKQTGKVDIFVGADLFYRDIFWNKYYEVLVNLTPGVKWYLGNRWQLAGQAIVPVYNDYGDRYKKVRLNMAVLSKEMDWNQKQFLKISGGLFGNERYGLDLKWMFPVNSWFALDAQAGWTGFCSMAVDWECSKMQRITGWLGANLYLNEVNTQMRIRGGRFLYEDYGVLAECMRHFKHCTVGVYGQYSNKGKENGGFKIVMMIPPYHRKDRKVNVRPASNFRQTYNYEADDYAVKMYTTDPEENEREGYFNRERLNWGANRMAPDFQEGGKQ